MRLYKHQRAILSYMRTNDSFAVFAEPGTGKTLPALCRLLDLIKSGKIDRALVVAPKSALGAWYRDIVKFSNMEAAILSGSIDFINYDKVWRGGNNSPYNREYGCIILDESHNIKNRTSRRASFLLKLSLKAKYRYILTGTPIANGALEDIWSQYTFLDPYESRGYIYGNIWRTEWNRIDGTDSNRGSYYEFLDRYAVLNMYHKPSSYVRVKELQEIINKYSYRITKEECLDLPEKLPDEIVRVECAERKLYKKLATESALLEYEILADNPLSRMTKLRQLCSGHITTEEKVIEVNCEKPEALSEILEGYPSNKKIVIFAEFVHSITKIKIVLMKLGRSFVTLDGRQKDKNIWRQFQEDPSISTIICQYKSANAGIDLYAADTMIFYEPTTQSVMLEQARDRIHRKGQKRPCQYIHLLTAGTVEMNIYKAVSGYEDFSEKFFVEYINQYRRSYTK